MKRWRLHMQASRLVGRADFVAAAAIYEQLLRSGPADTFAIGMLAHCYEQQERYIEALRLAEEAVSWHPESLLALQAAGRLAVATQDHDKAAQYLRRALALPEVRAEIPKEVALPKPLVWLLRILVRLPILRRRFPRDAFKEFELGSQAVELQNWKHWAQEYVAWHAGSAPGSPGNVVH